MFVVSVLSLTNDVTFDLTNASNGVGFSSLTYLLPRIGPSAYLVLLIMIESFALSFCFDGSSDSEEESDDSEDSEEEELSSEDDFASTLSDDSDDELTFTSM